MESIINPFILISDGISGCFLINSTELLIASSTLSNPFNQDSTSRPQNFSKEFEKDTEKKGLGTPANPCSDCGRLIIFASWKHKGKQNYSQCRGSCAIANMPDSS